MKTMKKYLHSAHDARCIDQKTIEETGIPSLVLMENAARAAASEILAHPEFEVINIVCGPGNNGADGMALARILQQAGRLAIVYMEEGMHLSPDEQVQLNICKKLHVPIRPYEQFKDEANLIVDSLFGSGLSREIKDPYKSIIKEMNLTRTPVWSMDIPSGVHGDTGEIMGSAVIADKVLALDCVKIGCLVGEGKEMCRDIVCLDIGIDESVHRQFDGARFMSEEDAMHFLPFRDPYGNKSDFGKVLMAGGSLSMQGALAMAGKACFASGCGTLTFYTPEKAARALVAKTDLAMIIPALEDEEGFFALDAFGEYSRIIPRFTTLALGNGMGRNPGSFEMAKTALESDLPLVLDADGINAIAGHLELLDRKAPLILTPHLKEFSRISGISVESIQDNPLKAALEFVRLHPSVTLVLKSAWTIIASSQQAMVLMDPNSALAKGGSGDVLCGICTGLLAQHMAPFEAACLACWIHNEAASKAVSAYSFTPLDLIKNLPEVFAKLQKKNNHD